MLLYKKVHNIIQKSLILNFVSLVIFCSVFPRGSVSESIYSYQKYTTKYLDGSKLEFCEICDIYLGGLFPIHGPKYARNSKKNSDETFNNNSELGNYLSTTPTISVENYLQSEFLCGEIKKERGIQRLEAMLFAIDLINNSTNLLPNLKLGARIFDTCDRDTIAMEKSLNFVSDYFLLKEENIADDFTCMSNKPDLISMARNFKPKKNKDAIHKRKVVGVVGAASSSVSIQVANLLRLFQVPQISYASTSPELSNKERFPFFSRVLPSDTLQAEAMANLVHSLNWNYIATLNEEGNLGGIDSFISNAKSKNICISGSYTLSQTASEDDVKAILMEMYEQKNARGVIVFLQDHNVRKLLKLVKDLNMTRHFLWIASDSWGTKIESIRNNNLAAEGAITFAPKSFIIKEFSEYFQKLRPGTNTRNPWFEEFWQDEFKCRIENPLFQPNRPPSYTKLCTGYETLNITQDGFIHFVIDSVFVIAHAIQDLIAIHCSELSFDELIKCQHKIVFKGPEFLKAIRNVNFNSITGRKVEFLKDKENSGDGLAPFEVFQYQKNEKGVFGYQKITEWEKNKAFVLDKSLLKWNSESNRIPRSVCKEECGIGEVKQGDHCCWVCVKCEENQYVDLNKCIKCPQGFGPNENKTNCVKLTIEYMTFNSPFTLIPIVFSTLGIILTIYIIYIFIRYNETPIIKASGRELCHVLLAGILASYLITFPLVTKPNFVSCLFIRFGFSTSLTICLSALFTKTNRLSRIFNNSIKKVRQASYVSPQSQLVICGSIVSVQVIAIFIWISISPSGISFDYDDPKRVILQCKTQNTHLAISFLYNFFLVILCTIYAIKTRKIPENFNEARFIGFTMYSICIIWVAFIPIYFGTTAAAGTSKSPKNNYKIQLTTMAMCLSLSATVILFCLFLPKIRVILLKPSKNVRTKSTLNKSSFKGSTNYKDSKVVLQSKYTGNFEKSLTVATVASSNSASSSPGYQSNKNENIAIKTKPSINHAKISNTSVKSCNISSTLEPEINTDKNEINYDDLNYSQQYSLKENESKNVTAVELGVTNVVDTLGEFSLKILNSQINDVNNNLVKLNNDGNSMESDEPDLLEPDYEYILTSRTPDFKHVRVSSKSLSKNNSLNKSFENFVNNAANLKNDSIQDKFENKQNEVLSKNKTDASKEDDLSISSLSIPSDISLENSKRKNSIHLPKNKKKDVLIHDSSTDANDYRSLKITFV